MAVAQEEQCTWLEYRRMSVVPASMPLERRRTSQNLQDSKDGTPMAVFAENVAVEYGGNPADFFQGLRSGWYLAAVPAGWMRQHNQEVYLESKNQEPGDHHPSHAAVAGPKDNKVRPRLAEKYEWVVQPPNRFDLQSETTAARSWLCPVCAPPGHRSVAQFC